MNVFSDGEQVRQDYSSGSQLCHLQNLTENEQLHFINFIKYYYLVIIILNSK